MGNKNFLALMSSFFVLSCVTPNFSKANKSGSLLVTCREDGQLAAKEFAFVRCEFNNTLDKPLDLNIAKVTVPDPNTVATPSDIQLYQASRGKLQSQKALTSLVVFGGMVAAGAAGTGVTGVGGTVMVAAESQGRAPRGTNGGQFGPEHLLGGSFTVAAKKSASKAVAIQLAESGFPAESMEVCFSKPAAECLDVAIEPWSGRSRLRTRE